MTKLLSSRLTSCNEYFMTFDYKRFDKLVSLSKGFFANNIKVIL
jgi:hypothetical protein